MFWDYLIRNFSDRTRSYEFKLKELEFILEMWKKFLFVRVVMLQ